MMGASGLDQLMMMEVSPTSSTSWSEGASGAVEAQAQNITSSYSEILQVRVCQQEIDFL